MIRLLIFVCFFFFFCSQSLIVSQGSAKDCGGILSEARGMLQTPYFPRKFPTPIRCRWVIDASQLTPNNQNFTIIVYFTQLFVSAGLKFTEYDYYERGSAFQLGGREIHRVTEQNVTVVSRIESKRHYLVVDFSLDHLEGNHLRVLDDLLDVYGFNISYEVSTSMRGHSCSVSDCSMSGHCYVSQDFREFSCSCFPAFSGPDCSLGPLCQPALSVCENGAVCKQVGAASTFCLCKEGFTGSKCEVRIEDQECKEGERCTTQCPEDNSREPCACGHRGQAPNSERARYEGTLRLANVTAVRQCLERSACYLKSALTNQISKYLQNNNLSIMEDFRVLEIGFSGELLFHFWGGKNEGSRVREALNGLVKSERLGNMSLVATHMAITQEPTLHLQTVRVDQPRSQVRQGDQFVISCVAQGSSHLRFQWFKDGVLVNVSKSKRSMWTRTLPVDSLERYTSLLGVEKADVLDRGTYTCQANDWGYQQCQSVTLSVLQAPKLRVHPMSITVEKGGNVTVKCVPSNQVEVSKFGYSWTKNNALFKMMPEQEFWEDLYPSGSILRLYNVQKSSTYSCHVHGSVRTVSGSMRVEVLNQSIAPWCPADETGVGGISWPVTGPGVQARVECPTHYQGVASRLCLLGEQQQPLWQTPDFSSCVSDKITSVTDNFNKVTLGFGNTTATDVVLGVLSSLRDRGVVYPGEAEPAVALLSRVAQYLNDTGALGEAVNSSQYFFTAVNTVLHHCNSLINHQKVLEVQQVVTMWAALWGAQSGTGSYHLAFDNLVVDMVRHDDSLMQGLTFHIPRPTFSYPQWFSARVTVQVFGDNILQNMSTSIAVIVYQKLSEFLPQRYSQTLENGSEVQFELASELVSVESTGALRVTSSLDLISSSRVGWELICGLLSSHSLLWNLTACEAYHLRHNRTLCQCPELGTVPTPSCLSRLCKRNGSEVQFELASELVSVEATGAMRVTSSLDLISRSRVGWELLCGVLSSHSSLWNLTACEAYHLRHNRTLCQCPQLGTHAVLLVKVVQTRGEQPLKMTPRLVLAGCTCCLVQTLLTLALLSKRWWHHRTCLLFLKVQYCACVVATMSLFLYAFSRDVPQTCYPTISTSLQAIILISMSSHMSKILLVYTEVVYIPNSKNLKQTIIAIMTGVPLIIVLSNHLAQVSLNVKVVSWWLVRKTVAFYTCLACSTVFTILFVFLHFHVSRRLKALASMKKADTIRVIQRRQGLINRAYVLFSGTSVMAASSVFYTNYPNINSQYVFTLSCALLGFMVLVCYVLHCESPPHQHVLKSIKVQHADNLTFSSQSDSSPLSLFTKQEGEVECEGAPPTPPPGGSSCTTELSGLTVRTSEHDLLSAREEQTLRSTKTLRKSSKEVVVDPGTTSVCVITSVVVNTPSVVVCSVDVEPYSVLYKSVVSPQALPVNDVEEAEYKDEDEEPPVAVDVMDRIGLDLDYLLADVRTHPELNVTPNNVTLNTNT